jgi:carbamoyl-phosphate synthase large subunit
VIVIPACLIFKKSWSGNVMNILVTGIGSDIGFNCGRILRGLDGVRMLHGIDISDDHPGRFVFDNVAVAPLAVAPDYLEWLARFIEQHDIDYVIPTSEAEIARIVDSDLPRQSPARFLLAGRASVTTSLDKHACLDFLEGRGIAVPVHGVVGDDEPSVWPVIVKPRSGQGSKGLMLCTDIEGYRQNAPAGSVWQEQLLPHDQEYTCPVYRSPAAGTRVLVLRRSLVGGLTGKGEVVDAPHIADYVEAIAAALDLCGAMNVQLRCTDRGPRLFEINPRLSSTVMFRHLLGFRDLEWWLMELAYGEVPGYSPIEAGARFYRGSQEYIVLPGTVGDERK